jgi:geranylgeranyl diphosphate synthase type I
VDERLRRALALVFGDRLFALAQRCLLDARLPERTRLLSRLLDCALNTGYGELADVLFGAGCLSGVSAEDIERMYGRKTARYTVECPLALAGLVAERSEAELGQLAAVAQPAGLAFQIQNDLREFVHGLRAGASDDLKRR